LLAFLDGKPAPNGEAPPGRVTKRDIAHAFGVKGEAKRDLKAMIRALQADGAVTKTRKALAVHGRLPAMVTARIKERDRHGELIAISEETEGVGLTRIAVLTPRLKRAKGPAPAIGQRVLLKTEPNAEAETGEPAYVGRIVKVLERDAPRALAVFRKAERGAARAEAVDKRERARVYVIPSGLSEDAEDGDLVRIEVLREGGFGLPAARVVERLGSVKAESAVSLIAIATHGIPDEFSKAALFEADKAKPASLEGREDWRALPLVTIDPVDARDHDDAVHATRDDDPANRGGFVLTVAIADVAHYVRPNSALDREALERGNSVYFPDRVVPMLPERISNDLCSLKPNEDRPALAVRMIIGADGRKRRHSFHRIMMRSAAKLSYEQAQRAIDGHADAVTRPLVESVLKPLYAAHAAIRIERDERDPLDLDLPERKLILDGEGKLKGVRWPERLESHRLIEEFMILANVAAAETLESQQSPLLYRVHDTPSLEKVSELSDFLATLGIKLAKGERMRPAHFNRALKHAKGQANETLVNEVVLRSQAQAEYAHENYGHFGLNLRRYAHFTSPIRRYADLIVHRALIRDLKLGADGLPDLDFKELKAIAEDLSRAERRAMAAERETADRLIAGYLSEQVGATFAARISGVTRAGLFVRLAETGADGFVPASTLGAERFHLDEQARAMVGARSRTSYRLGDEIEVKLVEAAPAAGALRFEIASEPEGRRAHLRPKRRR